MMFGNYNAYQPVGTPQFAMDQMQQFQQRAQMLQTIQRQNSVLPTNLRGLSS